MANILSHRRVVDSDSEGPSLYPLSRYLASTSKFLFMHTRIELLSRGHSIQCVDSDVNTRTCEILSSIHKPLEH